MTEPKSTAFDLRASFFDCGKIRLLIAIGTALLSVQFAPLKAQSGTSQGTKILSTPQWQTDAGTKRAFDFTSVRRNTSAPPNATGSNFPLGPGDVYVPNGGQFRAANYPLITYIEFAYKLTETQEPFLLSQLPKWAITDRFDIQGRAQGNPTKDQMRLMMQSLLADKFRLAVHYETRHVPVLALVMDQPGKLGPLLQKHPDDSPCTTNAQLPSPSPSSSPQFRDTRFPAACGGILGMTPSAPGRFRSGARNISMELFAASFPVTTETDRPVVDRTGLTGKFDYALEFTPQLRPSSPPGEASRRDLTGPTLFEALREQLGLKLEPQMGDIESLIIDYVQEPSAN
jgi:bla regulator protein blaR1